MSLIELADAIAAEAHDATGALYGDVPYIVHPREVALDLALAGHDDLTIAAGLLHDVLEDTALTADDLEQRGIPAPVIVSVVALTFRYFDRNETRDEYYDRIKRSGPRAVAVKRADVRRNQRNLPNVADLERRARLEKKYAKAVHALS